MATMENIRYENDEFMTWLKTTEYNGPIGATLKFYVKEESAKEFKDMIIKKVRSEMTKNKCKSMKLNVDFKDPNIFWINEEWNHVSDLKNWCTSDAYKNMMPALYPMMQDKPFQLALYKLEE